MCASHPNDPVCGPYCIDCLDKDIEEENKMVKDLTINKLKTLTNSHRMGLAVNPVAQTGVYISTSCGKMSTNINFVLDTFPLDINIRLNEKLSLTKGQIIQLYQMNKERLEAKDWDKLVGIQDDNK